MPTAPTPPKSTSHAGSRRAGDQASLALLRATPASSAATTRLALSRSVESARIDESLGAHDVHDDDRLSLETIEDAARADDHLAICGLRKPGHAAAGTWKSRESLDLPEHSLNEPPRGTLVLGRDPRCDVVQVVERRVGPDQRVESQRRILFFAFLCVVTRPSANALSPRAMPSRISSRRSSAS